MEIKVTLLYSRSQWIGESPKLKLRLAPSEFFNPTTINLKTYELVQVLAFMEILLKFERFFHKLAFID